MTRKLPDYLRSERRRSGLSQEDVAALTGSAVRALARYERQKRLPPLETALAYEAIFGVPVAELFGGRFTEIRRRVRRRAKDRSKKLASSPADRRTAYRKESLESIASR